MVRAVLFVALLLVLAPPAHAADNSEAQRHYTAGMAHYNLREYKEAIKEFEASYRLAPDPVFLFNLAQCHRLIKHDRDALYFYQAYLRARPEADNRAEVEKRIEALKKAVALLPPEPAKPEPAKPEPSETTTTGANTSTGSSAPAQTEHSNTVVGSSVSVAAAPAPRATPVYKKWWLWTIVGVVVVGAAVGTGVALGTRSDSRSYPLVNF
jgi:tetratricopeptide (TPR) repeat protein